LAEGKKKEINGQEKGIEEIEREDKMRDGWRME
jgi:hypothetical protein